MPVAAPQPSVTIDDDWVDELLLECTPDDNTDLYDSTEDNDDLNVGLPSWLVLEGDPFTPDRPSANT